MLTTLNPRAAGIDADSRQFFVAMPDGTVTVFERHTADLERLRYHLRSHGITTGAMEATGVDRLCLYKILEAVGLEVCLINSAHVEHLPGRKSAVQDCQWLQDLHARGLLRRSFVSPENTRALRDTAGCGTTTSAPP